MEADDAQPNNEITLAALNCFLDDALRSSCEGIMIKSLDVDAGYTPSKRSDTWLKVQIRAFGNSGKVKQILGLINLFLFCR